MIAAFLDWFRGRTAREQLLLQLAVFLVIGVGGAFLAHQAASGFRSSAASDLVSANALRTDVTRLSTVLAASPSAPPLESDGTPRGVGSAAASRWGLKTAHIEPAGPSAIRVTFDPAPASAIFQWVDAVEHAGLVVTRIALVRAGEGDLVTADATFGPRAS
jgi:type II secretory pathway component PulM